MTPSELQQLAAVLVSQGCPESRAGEMAEMLDRRAGQLQERTGRSHAEALAHLLNLMRQGWAAQERSCGGN